jgi:hypothetical protein
MVCGICGFWNMNVAPVGCDTGGMRDVDVDAVCCGTVRSWSKTISNSSMTNLDLGKGCDAGFYFLISGSFEIDFLVQTRCRQLPVSVR